MDGHSDDDVTAANDLELVQAARTGDRLAFGLLYLRHHAAAWRVACVSSRFSPDAELAVIEGFTRIFSALPENSEEFAAGSVSFRAYLLACVRQAALDRARAAGRAEGPIRPARRGTTRPESPPAGSPLTGLGPDGEVVLSSLEHHAARGALAALPERSRTALWLSDVEAMTATEVAGILGGRPQELADLAAQARAEVRAGRETGLGRHEVRADCRFTVANLDTFADGSLDPAKGVLVRSHLDVCPPCRMRLGELANGPATLAAAVPDAPLLGGETQHHWLSSADGIRPAERLLPPGLAAVTPTHRLPDVLRRAGRAAAGWFPSPDSIDLTTASTSRQPTGGTGSPDPFDPPGWSPAPGWSGSPAPARPPEWTVPPGRAVAPRPRDRRTRRLSRPAGAVGLPNALRRAGRAVWPALPATFLIVAWLGVMLALPRLMTPDTAPGPGAMALPAVQAYVPDYLPGAAKPRQKGSRPSTAPGGTPGSGSELAAPLAPDALRASSGPAGSATEGPSVKLIPTTRPSRPGPSRPDAPAPIPEPSAGIATSVIVTVSLTPVPAPGPATAPLPDPDPAPVPVPLPDPDPAPVTGRTPTTGPAQTPVPAIVASPSQPTPSGKTPKAGKAKPDKDKAGKAKPDKDKAGLDKPGKDKPGKDKPGKEKGRASKPAVERGRRIVTA